MRFVQSYKIKNRVLKNRFIVAPIKTSYASLDGEVNEKHIRFYKNLAKSGASVVIIEPVSVSQNGKEHPKQLNIHKDNSVENLKKIAKVIKENGSIAAIHLNHAGRGANKKATKTDPIAPSPIMCPMSGLTPLQMDKTQIDEIIEDYKKAIKNSLEAGFEFIELQCGHGNLIHQFLSKRLNKRNDEYGQDRTLFLKKVLELFKNINIIKSIRISASEFVQNGWEPKDNKILIDLAKEYGFDLVHCGFGNLCDTPPWYYSHMSLNEDMQIDALREVRKISSLPIIAVGKMASVEKLNLIEREDLADFIAFGRPVISDMQIVNKIIEKRYDEINFCGYCLQGCLYNVKQGKGLGCIINPLLDKEEIKPAKTIKHIAIIGSGPAGISAALTLKERGHKVTLIEKDAQLGGNFRLSYLAVGKESMKRPFDSLIKRTKREIENIILNADLDIFDFKEFDEVLIASGSKQNLLDIKGLKQQYVITSLEFFKSQKEIKGDRILIIGGGMIGMEAADILSKKYDVTVIEKLDDVANDMETITKKMLIKRLSKSGVKILTKCKIISFEDGLKCNIDGKDIMLKTFDTVILAAGLVSDDEVAKYFDNKGISYKLIGDANKVSNIYEATKNGYEVAVEI